MDILEYFRTLGYGILGYLRYSSCVIYTATFAEILISQFYTTESRHLPRHKWMTRTQPPTDRPRLAIDIATLITPQKQRYTRNLVPDGAALHGVQLSNLALRAARPRRVVHGLRHARLHDTGADGVDPDARPRELICACLGDGHHCGL